LTKLVYYYYEKYKPCIEIKKEIIMGLSDRIRTIVSDLDISQTQFADTLGVSFTYINCLINGKRGNISQSLAILIQKLYGYSAQWLLFDEGDAVKKVIHRNLGSRPRLVAVLNTLTKDEIDMVVGHTNYVVKETVANIAMELSDLKGIKTHKL
jgi:transcriptional regulator with XRE-family HTH domain